MTRTTDHGAAQGCVRHDVLALAAAPGADAAGASRALDDLARTLRGARSRSARQELTASATLLAATLVADRSGTPETFRLDRALAAGYGAPVILGVIAVTAARQAGIALGLLTGPAGRLVIAHAMLAQPLVLDLDAGFGLLSIAGDEPLYRWACAHETARRVETALAA